MRQTEVQTRSMAHQSHSLLHQKGVTLIELVSVMLILGICSAVLTVFIRPAIDAYLAVKNRAALTADAQSALRMISQDVRVSVPNSLRSPNGSCLETVPTSSGGSYRIERDIVNDAPLGCSSSATCSASLDTSASTSAFDVFTPLSTPPQIGDWVVVANQVPEQIFGGSNRALVTAIQTPRASDGVSRLSISPTQFPLGYSDGRFVVVPKDEAAVTYACEGADGTLNAQGDGKGVLYRLSGYGFNANLSSCPSAAALAGATVVTRGVRSCNFVYSPNSGATQQNGFLAAQIDLARNNESVSLVNGVHVDNVP